MTTGITDFMGPSNIEKLQNMYKSKGLSTIKTSEK